MKPQRIFSRMQNPFGECLHSINLSHCVQQIDLLLCKTHSEK
jgi:hypothetical protein